MSMKKAMVQRSGTLPFVMALLVAGLGGISVGAVDQGPGYHVLGVGMQADVRREEDQAQSDSGGWFETARIFFHDVHKTTTIWWSAISGGLVGADSLAISDDVRDAQGDQSGAVIAKVDKMKMQDQTEKVSMSGEGLSTRTTAVHAQDETPWITNMSGPDLRQRQLVLG